MTGDRENYIRYRLEKAKQTLSDAETLIRQNSWNSAINRLYYSCFYAVSALLFRYDINHKTHNGTKIQFYRYFILTGKIDKHFSHLYSDLSDWRQAGDYADFFEFDEETVKPLPEKVRRLIATIEKLL